MIINCLRTDRFQVGIEDDPNKCPNSASEEKWPTSLLNDQTTYRADIKIKQIVLLSSRPSGYQEAMEMTNERSSIRAQKSTCSCFLRIHLCDREGWWLKWNGQYVWAAPSLVLFTHSWTVFPGRRTISYGL